jgi:hypothetical protein
MQIEVNRILELLETRARYLRLLADHLLAGQEALVRWELEAAEMHIAQQEMLCRKLRQVDLELSEARPEVVSDPEVRARLQGALGALHDIRDSILHINNIQAEFLRRSRRSLRLLSSLVQSSLGLYEPAKLQPQQIPAAGRLG